MGKTLLKAKRLKIFSLCIPNWSGSGRKGQRNNGKSIILARERSDEEVRKLWAICLLLLKLISASRYALIEVKSSISRCDVAMLLRKGKLYERLLLPSHRLRIIEEER